MASQMSIIGGHEFEQTLGDSEGRTGKPGVLQHMSHKKSDPEQLNNNNSNNMVHVCLVS